MLIRLAFVFVAASLAIPGCSSKTQQSSPTSPTAVAPPAAPAPAPPAPPEPPPPPPPAPTPTGVAVHSTLRPAGAVAVLDGVWTERTADNRMTYDDFRLPSTAIIQSIAWQGIRETGSRPARFYVAFIPDSGNRPRMEPDENFRPRAIWSAVYPIEQANERLDLTKVCENSPQRQCGMYDYSVTMATPFTAEAGTQYWILIQAESPPTYQATGWNWRKGTRDNGYALTSLAGTTFPWDMAFALRQ